MTSMIGTTSKQSGHHAGQFPKCPFKGLGGSASACIRVVQEPFGKFTWLENQCQPSAKVHLLLIKFATIIIATCFAFEI